MSDSAYGEQDGPRGHDSKRSIEIRVVHDCCVEFIRSSNGLQTLFNSLFYVFCAHVKIRFIKFRLQPTNPFKPPKIITAPRFFSHLPLYNLFHLLCLFPKFILILQLYLFIQKSFLVQLLLCELLGKGF